MGSVAARTRTLHYIDGQMGFTSAIGAIFMFPLRIIIRVCVALRIHPNVLTLIGVCINLAAAWALARGGANVSIVRPVSPRSRR